ncbi:uncharacterized protein LOC113312248 [Papaver somniferum]|uniref:uncharacterized protein LOC113312248 n=1 Tax=Papaver somniferum TaxID=3469 RepID=UPI000E6FE6AD|nr:uncharacterized protein LOC113312248 [Papaver somniferum]
MEEFGGVKQKKKELTKKIEELDNKEEFGELSNADFEERLKTCLDLQSVELMEARKWNVRAKQNEFKWGDSNTSYFHRIASARRKRNTIVKLEIDDEECFDQNIIKLEIKDFYSNLFVEHNDVAFSLDNLSFPKIDDKEKLWMEREFSEEEAYNVKDCNAKLVSNFQGAFVKNKQILDGVLIASECVNSRLKDKKVVVLCKINMEKAFDNVKWKTL